MASDKKWIVGDARVIAALICVFIASLSCSKPLPKTKPENSANDRPQTVANATVPADGNISGPVNVQLPANVEYFENDATNRIGKGSTLDRAKRRQRPDLNPNASPVPPTLNPAPENSEGAITMLPDGTISEIRIFRSHPTLARVDTFFAKPGLKRVKFTFKDGKVVEAETDKIENLLTTPTASLLQIAGKR
jgi:hypothetical protein